MQTQAFQARRSHVSAHEANMVSFKKYLREAEKKRHTPPCPSKELFFAERNGGHRGKISVVDMVFLVCSGFLYSPLAWKTFFQARKVVQKIFCRWWSCTLSSSLRGCIRSFRPREQESPWTLLHHPNPDLHRCKEGCAQQPLRHATTENRSCTAILRSCAATFAFCSVDVVFTKSCAATTDDQKLHSTLKKLHCRKVALSCCFPVILGAHV